MTDWQNRGIRALLWAIPAVVAYAIARNPVTLADLGWQLQLGRLMAVSGPFLHEPFVATHLGEALIPNAWLAQVVYARVFDWTGFRGLRAFDAVLWISGPLLATIPGRLRQAKPTAILYALVIGFGVALPSAIIRPQSFASLGFGLALVMVQYVRSWRTALLLGVPLFVLWQNLHPSVAVAALTIGAIAAVQWAQWLGGKAAPPVALSVLALVAGGAVFATPAGLAIIAFAQANTAASLAFGATEWFPLWHPYHRSTLLSVLASAAVVLLIAVRHRKDMTVGDVVPVLVTLAMALTMARFIVFYAIAIIPLLTRLDVGNAFARKAGARQMAADCAISALLVVGVCLLRPQIASERDTSAALIAGQGHGTVFCDPTLAGAILLDGYPQWRVAFDGRYFLYRPDEIDLLRRAAWDGSVVADIERRYHPAAYALNASRSPALVQALSAHPDIWRRAHDNRVSVLFLRR